MSDVLIAGCGYVGNALGASLLERGHRVWGIRRNAGLITSGVTPIAADLCDLEQVALPSSLEWAFFTAAADSRTDEAYERVYVHGLKGLLAALQRARASLRRVCFTSSTAVYGQQDGQWVDEHSATDPQTFSGQRLLEAERVLASGSWPSTVVRLAGIYGPGRTRLLRDVEAGTVSSSSAFTNRIHRDDCAGVLAHVMMGIPEPASVYIGVDSDPAPLSEVATWLAGRLGVPYRASDASERERGNKRCSNARLIASGYEFAYPSFREGYVQVIADWLDRRDGRC